MVIAHRVARYALACKVIPEVDPDVPYVLYCRSGNRSGQTLSLMDQLGFTDVVEVGGGIQAWEAAGLPVER